MTELSKTGWLAVKYLKGSANSTLLQAKGKYAHTPARVTPDPPCEPDLLKEPLWGWLRGLFSYSMGCDPPSMLAHSTFAYREASLGRSSDFPILPVPDDQSPLTFFSFFHREIKKCSGKKKRLSADSAWVQPLTRADKGSTEPRRGEYLERGYFSKKIDESFLLWNRGTEWFNMVFFRLSRD